MSCVGAGPYTLVAAEGQQGAAAVVGRVGGGLTLRVYQVARRQILAMRGGDIDLAGDDGGGGDVAQRPQICYTPVAKSACTPVTSVHSWDDSPY